MRFDVDGVMGERDLSAGMLVVGLWVSSRVGVASTLLQWEPISHGRLVYTT